MNMSMTSERSARVLRSPEAILLVALIVLSFVPAVGGLVRVAELLGGPTIMPANPRAATAPLPIAAHALGSLVFCIAGAWQLLPVSRRHGSHRGLGRIVAAAGLVAAGTGVWMTHTFAFPAALQGPALYLARIVLGAAMLGLIVRGVHAIRSGNLLAHGAAMLRAYAIGQGAATQAFLGLGWMLATGTEPAGGIRDTLMISAWMLNIVVAEVVIGRILAPGYGPRRPAGGVL